MCSVNLRFIAAEKGEEKVEQESSWTLWAHWKNKFHGYVTSTSCIVVDTENWNKRSIKKTDSQPSFILLWTFLEDETRKYGYKSAWAPVLVSICTSVRNLGHLERGISIEKMSPLDFPIGKSVYTFFSSVLLTNQWGKVASLTSGARHWCYRSRLTDLFSLSLGRASQNQLQNVVEQNSYPHWGEKATPRKISKECHHTWAWSNDLNTTIVPLIKWSA